MKRQVILGMIILAILLSASGCISGTGFEKKTTLMPDSVGISIGQQHYDSGYAPWAVSVGAQWNLE